MTEDPPFAESERTAGERLGRLRTKWGNIGLRDRNTNGEIAAVDLRGITQFDEEAIRALAGLNSLRQVVADSPFACNLLFEVLAHSPCIEEIVVLNAGSVTDCGVSLLPIAPKLQRLDIRGAAISDAGAQAIGRIRTLTSLALHGSLVTNDGLRHLGCLADLHMLSITGTLIDDAGLAHLSGLKRLSFLSLERTRVRGHGCVHLRVLKRLKYLLASESSIDDEGLAALADFPKLEHLVLKGTRVTDEGIPHLALIPRLTEVNLMRCQITDASVPAFARCTRLKSLYAEDTAVTSDGRKELKAFLPKCSIFVSAGGVEADEDAPWQDRAYFWKHPPECLARFKLAKKRDKDLDEWTTRFQLACRCGHRKGEVRGYPLSRFKKGRAKLEHGDLFVGPLSFRCDKCQSITEIIDTDNDGYHGRLGASAVYRGKGKPEPYTCSECNGTVWQIQATIEMNEGAFDIWYDDQEIALENYFDVFQLHGTCTGCKKVSLIANFANLG